MHFLHKIAYSIVQIHHFLNVKVGIFLLSKYSYEGKTDDIVAGTSMPRNNFLFANAIYLLPYTGAGSGIQRALSQDKRLSFSNNESLHEFVTTIERENVQVEATPNTKKGKSNYFHQGKASY